MIWFMLSLLACESDLREDDDDDGGGIIVGTETGQADTAPPEDTGWECNPWYPCQECGGAACGSELSDCLASGTCSAALNSWAACVLDCGDPEACAGAFASSSAQADALAVCVSDSCAEECDL